MTPRSVPELAQQPGHQRIALPIVGAGSGGLDEAPALDLILSTLNSSCIGRHVRQLRRP